MINANHIPVVKFHKRKYGEELLIDIVTLETIRRSPHFSSVQRQSFYGIMLTTAGEANVEVDELVDEHYLTESGVEFYADKLAVTSNYLNRLVKQNLGQSIKQYIQNRRIDEAKRLLRYTELSVADIAEQLNFETSSYFVRAFSKVTKTTPLKYRASN